MKRLPFAIAAAGSLVMLVLGAVSCVQSKRALGNTIVAKIEEFKRGNGRLPSSLSEVGVKESESCPCYCKTSDSGYIVWYGTTLGESDTYDSRTRKWAEVGQGVCSR